MSFGSDRLGYEEWLDKINSQTESDELEDDDTPNTPTPTPRRQERGIGLKRRPPMRSYH